MTIRFISRVGALAAAALMGAAAHAATADAGPAQAIERKIPDGPPSAMTNAAIAEHNKDLDARHPDFIKRRGCAGPTKAGPTAGKRAIPMFAKPPMPLRPNFRTAATAAAVDHDDGISRRPVLSRF